MVEMEYTKPSLDINQQVNLLLSRGMQGDPAYMASKLTLVSYYRLSAYWRIYRNADDTFHSSPEFEHIWHLYMFDRKLRLLVMDAIERIEIALRSRLAYHHSQAYGPFGYAYDPSSMPTLNRYTTDLFAEIDRQLNMSRAPFIEHFKRHYSDNHAYPPIWMTVEVVSYGTLVNIYRCIPGKIKKAIASEFDVASPVFESWANTLRPIRNICAHHARLWNTTVTSPPVVPYARNSPQWHSPHPFNNAKMYSVLTVCKWCLDAISPSSNWKNRVFGLFNEFPDVPVNYMDIPDNWQSHPIWR